jgi:type IV pilus assembly protein PilP
MCNYIKILITIAILTGFFLLCGCDNQEEKTQKATVISKKIVTPEEEKQALKKDEKIESLNAKTKKKELMTETSKIKTEPEQKIELSETTFAYKVEGKIDPFASIFRDESAVPADEKDRKKKKRIPLTPIERVDLSQLKLVGIIFASSGNKALVEDASGKGFIIKKDTRIGINSGRVLKILKDRIIVEEESESILGKKTLLKRELKLQKPPGEE